MLRAILSPAAIAEKREKTKAAFATIRERERLENLHQMQDHLLAKGHMLSKWALEKLESGECSLTAALHAILWSAFGAPELDPATYGPTVDEPALVVQQLRTISAVVKDFMERRDVTTSSQLSAVLGISRSSGFGLINGGYLPAWVTMERIRKVIDDPRLMPETFGHIDVETMMAGRKVHKGLRRLPTTDDDHHVALLDEATLRALLSAIEEYKRWKGIDSWKQFERALGLGTSTVSNLRRGRASPAIVRKIKAAIAETKELHERSENDASRTPEAAGGLTASPADDVETAALKRMGFLLTSRSFRPINFSPTEDQVEDTAALIRELYKRLVLFAMTSDPLSRAQLRRQLGPYIDEFYLALQVFEAELPTNIVRIIEAQRRSFPDIERMRTHERREGG